MFPNSGDNSWVIVDDTSEKTPSEQNEDDDDDETDTETTLTDYSKITKIRRSMASPAETPSTPSPSIKDKTRVPSVQDKPSIKPQPDVKAAIEPEPDYIKYVKRFLVFLISQAGLTVLVFGYIVIGGAIFQSLEKRKVKSSSLTITCIRRQHVKVQHKCRHLCIY